MPQARSERRHVPRQRWRPSRAIVVVAIAALVVAGAAYGLTAQNGGVSQSGPAQPWFGAQLVGLPGGVLIAAVEPGSPAQAAGLHSGDLIISVEGRPVVAPVDVSAAVSALKPGKTLELQYQRQGTTYTAAVMLKARPSGSAYP